MRDTPRTRILLAVALILALGLIAIDYQNRSSAVIARARRTAGTVFGDAERGVSSVTRPVGRFFDSGLTGSTSSGQVAALQRQLAAMRAQLSAAELSKAQDQQLGQLLRVTDAGRYKVVAASVIAHGQDYQQTVTLNAGSASGVRAQQTVLNGEGLVGQVIAVSVHTCTVLLASDANSVVGIRLAPSGQVGWVTGQGASKTGAGLLTLSVLNAGTVLNPGEQLVTAASVNDRPFVPGVPVGVITAVKNRAGGLTAQAVVRPYANLSAVDVVGVVIGTPRVDPGYSVLPSAPPKPGASTSARRGRQSGTRSKARPRPHRSTGSRSASGH